MTFTPVAGFRGVASIDYRISNGNIDNYTISHVAVGLPIAVGPTAGDDVVSTAVGTPVSVAVLDNAVGASPTIADVTFVGANGTGVANADGTIEYTPNEGFSGTDTVYYHITDDSGLRDAGVITVLVGSPADSNTGPEAVNDAVSGSRDTPVVIGVLDNDTEPDGDVLTVALLDGPDPATGSVSVNPDSTFTFTPAAGFVGLSSFRYTASDPQGLTSVGIVSVAIGSDTAAAPDLPPEAQNDEAIVNAGGSVDLNPLGNDIDPEVGALTVTAVGTSPNGTANLNADGSVSYQPDGAFVGQDVVSYVVADAAGNQSEGLIRFTVTPAGTTIATSAPDTGNDILVTPQDSTTTYDVLANDTDADSSFEDLTVAIASPPTMGTAVVNADNTITYTPTAGFFGCDIFTYTVTDDQGNIASATVLVEVNAVWRRRSQRAR